MPYIATVVPQVQQISIIVSVSITGQLVLVLEIYTYSFTMAEDSLQKTYTKEFLFLDSPIVLPAAMNPIHGDEVGSLASS